MVDIDRTVGICVRDGSGYPASAEGGRSKSGQPGPLQAGYAIPHLISRIRHLASRISSQTRFAHLPLIE